MPNPWNEIDHRLTGRTRVRVASERVGLFGSRQVCVVQVEETCFTYPMMRGRDFGHDVVRWRDMVVHDLTNEKVFYAVRGKNVA